MKRWFWLAIFATTMSYAQTGVRYDNNVWTAATNVPLGRQAPVYTVPYALVKVCTDSSCAALVPIYNNSSLTPPAIAQPLKSDAYGRYGFWAAAGTYWVQACSSTNLCKNGYITLAGSGTGSGTVTSVGLSMPAMFTITGSPITSSGTLTATLANQNANLVFAGPSSGSAAAPTFRALTPADLPTLFSLTTIGTSGPATYSGGV